MGHRLSRIVTRTGDDGSTGLGDGSRIAKDHARIEAIGTVDEANACIGLLLAATSHPDAHAVLVPVQHQLFDLGAELCIPGHAALADTDIAWLEAEVSRLNAPLPPLREFVLPGGSEAAARCHVARTVARRAERCCVALSRTDAVRPEALRYLNRLSDLLFVLGRVLALADGGAEVLWQRERRHPA